MKAYKFNPIKELELDIPRSNRKAALEDAATYIKEAMLDYIGEGKSPVEKGKWVRSLTKQYAKTKSEQSSANFANLELTGEMLDSLTVDVSGSNIIVDVGDDQRDKAEGHLTGIYGDSNKIRPRQFMPQKGESFKREIMSNIKKILEDYES